MTNRENFNAIMHYEKYEKMPVVHFGYWHETLEKWMNEGHISKEMFENYGDGNEYDRILSKRFGFDYCYSAQYSAHASLMPGFESKILETFPDGSYHELEPSGEILLKKPGKISIPPVVGTLMTGREAWEEKYLPQLEDNADRVDYKVLDRVREEKIEYMPRGIFVGSLFGRIRDWLGVENISYLGYDDPDLYKEIIDTVANLCYVTMKRSLEYYDDFDFAHYWEDICFKNGPLISPKMFSQYVGPHYKRMTDLLKEHGIDIVSLDCDGDVTKLVPIWLENGVNTMFPIEVGTWHASIAPWREEYGKELRGVGGMDKNVLSQDYAAIDAEIERLKPLIELGGYIPCPDHRIPPGAIFENVQYYCDKMQNLKL